MRDISDPKGQWWIAAGQAFYRCPFSGRKIIIDGPDVVSRLREQRHGLRHGIYIAQGAEPQKMRELLGTLKELRDAWHKAQRLEPAVLVPAAAAGSLPSSTPQGPVARFRSWLRDMPFCVSSLG